MENCRFRSRSESPFQRTRTEKAFMSSKEWVEAVRKAMYGIRGQIEVYQILLENDATHPPTYLIQGLLKCVTELEGSENKPKAPIGKRKTKDSIHNSNGQVVEEVNREQEKNTKSPIDEDKVKDLLNQSSQQVNKKSSVTTSKCICKCHCYRNSHRTSIRKVITKHQSFRHTISRRIARKESGVNGVEQSRRKKVGKDVAGLAPPRKKLEKSISKGKAKVRMQKVDAESKQKDNQEKEAKMQDHSNNINQAVENNNNSTANLKNKRSPQNAESHRMFENESGQNITFVPSQQRAVRQATEVQLKSNATESAAKVRNEKSCSRSSSSNRRKQNEKEVIRKRTEQAVKEKTGAQDNINKTNQKLQNDSRANIQHHHSSKNTPGVRSKSKTAESQVKVGNRKSASSSNSSSSSGRGSEKANRKKSADIKEKEKAVQEKKLEESNPNQINHQVDNSRANTNKHQRSKTTTLHRISQKPSVRSKSKAEELKTKAIRRSAGSSNCSSGGGTTSAKRARVYIKTDIDSATGSFSRTKGASKPSCSPNSCSVSQSAPPFPLKETSHEKRDIIQAALKEPKILSNIMSKLRTTDLINSCRLVKSSWKETANSILIKRRNLKAIHLRFVQEKKTFFLDSLKHHELSELQNVLENSTNFPCDDFKIDGPLDHPDLQKFLSSFGGQIRKLDLELPDFKGEKVVSFYSKLFKQQAVNLNSLVLRESCFGWKGMPTKLFPFPVVLQKLSHLELPGRWRHSNEFPWTKEFLGAAPNLQSFRTSSVNTKTLDSLVNLNKAHLFTEMNLDAKSNVLKDEQILSEFKLKNLCHDLNQDEYSRQHELGFLLRVLHLNEDTLTSISLEFCDAVNLLQTTNVFHHVKTFALVGLEIKTNVNQGSNKISLHNLFPNLETIRLEGPFNYYYAFHTVENFPFMLSEPMEKVNRLEIQNSCPVQWLKLLPQLFPNVGHLILENYWDLPRSGHSFWAFTSLKSMDMVTLLGVANLDSVFTGFSSETCKSLGEKSQRALHQRLESGVMEIKPEAEIEQLRVAPSIVQLKSLRELRIKVTDTTGYIPYKFEGNVQPRSHGRSRMRWSNHSNVDLMSPVTSIYAFGMMPSLQAVDILLTPNESIWLPWQKMDDSMRRLHELAAALTLMAKHPLVTLYPIQMNNDKWD